MSNSSASLMATQNPGTNAFYSRNSFVPQGVPTTQTHFNMGQIPQTVTTRNIATPNSAHQASIEARKSQPATLNATNIVPHTYPQYANQATFASIENQGYINDVPNAETQSTSSNSRHNILKPGSEPAYDRQENGPGYGAVQTDKATHGTAQYEVAPSHSVATTERYKATATQATTIPHLDRQPYIVASCSSSLATSAPYPLVATSVTTEKYKATVPRATAFSSETGLIGNPGQHIAIPSTYCVPPAISHSVVATSATVAPHATAIFTPINAGQQHIATPFSSDVPATIPYPVVTTFATTDPATTAAESICNATRSQFSTTQTGQAMSTTENATETTTQVVATDLNKAPAQHAKMQQHHATTTVHPTTPNKNIVTSSARTTATTVPRCEAVAATYETSSSQSVTPGSGIPAMQTTTKAPEISMTTVSTPEPSEVCTPKRMPNSDYTFKEDMYRQSPVPNVSSVFATAMTSLYGDPPVDLEPLAHTVFHAEPPVAPIAMCNPPPYSGSPVSHMMLHQFRASPARSPALSIGRLIILNL